MNQERREKCCGHDAHAQIEYHGYNGAVETLVGVDVKNPETVKLLHDMLDEWITKSLRRMGEPDHFIVYRKWPVS